MITSERLRPTYRQGKDDRIMGRTPKPDEHRTSLQRRLAGEVRAGMDTHGMTQAELSRHTGIGEPHISLLLRGLRQGTISAWDKLLCAAHGTRPMLPPVKAEPTVVEQLAEVLDVPVVTKLSERRPAVSLNPRRPS